MKILAALVLTGVVSVAGQVGAQVTGSCLGSGAIFPTIMSVNPKLPMRLTLKTTVEQQLPDGNSIRREVTTREAQNGEGWSRREFVTSCFLDDKGRQQVRLQVAVYKPDEKETLRWEESSVAAKYVTLNHMVEFSPERKQQLDAERDANSKVPHPSRNEWVTEDLGSSTISGVEVTGLRSVRTIPAGEEGNSLPVRVVSETWSSKDHVTMRRVEEDPRTGKITREVKEIVFGEPDTNLFAPPEGYLMPATTKTVSVVQ